MVVIHNSKRDHKETITKPILKFLRKNVVTSDPKEKVLPEAHYVEHKDTITNPMESIEDLEK